MPLLLVAAAKLEAEAAAVRLQSGILQGPYQMPCVPPHDLQRLGPVDADDRIDPTIAGELQVHLGLTERFGRELEVRLLHALACRTLFGRGGPYLRSSVSARLQSGGKFCRDEVALAGFNVLHGRG